MGFFSRRRKAFKSVIASFGMLFGLLVGCGVSPKRTDNTPVTSIAKEPSRASIDLGITGLTINTSGESGVFSKTDSAGISGNLYHNYAVWGKDSTLKFAFAFDEAIFSVTLDSFSVLRGSLDFFGESNPAVGKQYSFRVTKADTKKIVLKIDSQANPVNKKDCYSRIGISNISLTPIETFSTVFEPDLNFGKMFVDESEILQSTTIQRQSDQSYSLRFEPKSGYVFLGWQVDGTHVSSSNPYSFYGKANNQIVRPKTASSDLATFSVGGLMFSDLNEAIAKAKSGSDKTIVAVKDGTVASGNYTLDSGLSLLIPNEGGAALLQYATEDPKYVTKTATQCTLFRKISFSNGAHLNVYGQVVVCCTPVFKTVTSDKFNNHTAIPSGTYGQIEMQQGSTMNIQNGAKLYAWGYVTGDGLVEAQSGATVYELFQIASWRGGNVAKDMNKNKQKVFVINQYYVQNIECELKLWAGAVEKTLTGMYMSYESIEKVPHPTFVFIGNGGMFNLTRGYLTKKYVPSSDRLEIEVWGDGQLSSIAFSLSISFALIITFNIEMDAKDYVLPINNNISITIKSGFACSTNQDLGFLPGSELIIEKGASFEVQSGHNLTFYDLDNWGNYATEAKLRPVLYSPTRTKTRTEADLTDAKLALDGTLTIGSGSYLMTTGQQITGNAETDQKTNAENIGARIISPGRTGVIKFTDANATSYPAVYQYDGHSTDKYVAIDHSCAKLQNGDHSYTQSAPGNTYNYDKVLDHWSLSTDHATKSGLFKTIDNNGVIKTVLLENDVMSTGRSGLFYYSSTTYKAGDNHYYYLQAGAVVNNKKWYQEGGKWYFFGTNQYAYQNMSAVFTASTGIAGFGIQARYFFSDTATVERLVTVGNVVGLSSDIAIDSNYYCYYKSIKAGVGLFEKQSGSNYSVYLAEDDGSLMRNGTYYVSSNKINSIKDSSGKVLNAGLYYFDENGHMYDSNFKVITRGNAS